MTNEEGNFKVKNTGSRLIISCIGFKSEYIRIDTLKSLPAQIILKPISVSLGEVIVKPMDVKEIVRNSITKLSNNYPASFIKINGIFKQLTKTNGIQNTYLNADLNVYINILSKLKSRKIVTTLNNYEIFKNKKERTIFSEPSGALNILYFSIHPFINQIDKYNFNIVCEFEYEDMKLIKINFEPEKRNDKNFQYKGSFFIDKATDAIIYVEYELLPVSKINKNILFGISQKQEFWKCKIMFEKWNNNFVPKYIISESIDILKIKKETTETHDVFNFFSKSYENYSYITLPVNQSLKDLLFKSVGAEFNKEHKYADDFILETTQEKNIKKQYGQ